MIEINNNAIRQSYVNEYKGNLLEFMLARSIAQSYGLEVNFLKGLDSQLMKTLSQYEKELRKVSPELLKTLPLIAQQVFETIKKQLPQKVTMVDVIGKKAQYAQYKEADILIGHSEGLIPLSLKLCKDNSYINTKSGGIKSFFTKYFSEFEGINKLQSDLNFQSSVAFEQMAFDLHEYFGLSYKGFFSDEFIMKAKSELPGHLSEDLKKIVHHYYYQCIQKFYELFILLSEKDEALFSKSLMPILGLGHADMWQVAVLYKKDYLVSKIHLQKSIKGLSAPFKLIPLKPNKSYFYLQIGADILQIRMKPMNKYTVEGLKVNCSVKFG
ncbi:MAG: hypothetical protein ACO20H_05375 [Bacteriovoracaceae bacterium]